MRPLPPDEAASLQPGRRVFARYTLHHEIGRGGMGVVWRVRDEELERDIALKFLPEAVAHDPEAIRDLKRETRRCLELTHPHIVRVYDLVQDAGAAAIAMELVEGQSLARHKAEAPGACLNVTELAPLVAQLCSAIDYAHRTAKVAHRDLKPANLLVTTAGLLKVTDFGIARSLSETHTRLTGSAATDTSGTLLYMSPQQLAGDQPSAADDIYALGVTLYELLTGKPPFYRGEVLTQVRERSPAPLAAHRQAVGAEGEPIPPVWETVILACLAKTPAGRPASAADVARQLGLVPALTALSTSPVPLPLAAGPASAVSSPESDATLQMVDHDQTVRALPPAPVAGAHAGGIAPPVRRSWRWWPWALGLAVAVMVLWGSLHLRRLAPLPASSTAVPSAVSQPAGPAVTPASPPPAPSSGPFSAIPAAVVPPPVASAREFTVLIDPPSAPARLWLGPVRDAPVVAGRAVVRQLPDGEQALTVKAAGFQPVSTRVLVREGGGQAEIHLVPLTGTAIIVARRGSTVTALAADGRITPLGAVSAAARLRSENQLPLGTYRFAVTHPDCTPAQSAPVELTEGQTLEVTVEQEPLPGELRVRSAPAGAEIFVDGVRAGTTPATLRERSERPLAVEVRLSGYKTATASVQLQPLEARTLDVGALVAIAPAALARAESFWSQGTPAAKVSGAPLPPGGFVLEDLALAMASLPAGTFTLGSAGGAADEQPTTQVTLARFWLGQTEVTQAQYQLLMGQNPSRFRQPTRPVENVSWADALTFCQRLTERERQAGRLPAGYAYTLPTEAQWEYACRAGTTTDYLGDLGAVAWYETNSGNQTHPVGQKRANAWNLYDLQGNVWEWCLDWYGPYVGGALRDPTGAPSGTLRVIRGGGWFHAASYCRASARRGNAPDAQSFNLGFRLALSPVR